MAGELIDMRTTIALHVSILLTAFLLTLATCGRQPELPEMTRDEFAALVRPGMTEGEVRNAVGDPELETGDWPIRQWYYRRHGVIDADGRKWSASVIFKEGRVHVVNF